jgi:hypothetical protein
MKTLLGAGLFAALAMVGGPALASDNVGFRALANLNSVSELSDGQLAAIEGAGSEDNNGRHLGHHKNKDNRNIVFRVSQDVSNTSTINLDDVHVSGHSTLSITVTQTATANAFTR